MLALVLHMSLQGPGPPPGNALGWGGEAQGEGGAVGAQGRVRLSPAGPVLIRAGTDGGAGPSLSSPSQAPPRSAPGPRSGWKLQGLGRMWGSQDRGEPETLSQRPLGQRACAARRVGIKSQGQAPRSQKSIHKLWARVFHPHACSRVCICLTLYVSVEPGCVHMHMELTWVGSRQCEPHECVRNLQDTCSCVHTRAHIMIVLMLIPICVHTPVCPSCDPHPCIHTCVLHPITPSVCTDCVHIWCKYLWVDTCHIHAVG